MKWLLVVVAVLVVLVGTVALIGLTLPQNHTASRSAHVNARPDSLWDIITDVERYPTWRKDLGLHLRYRASAARRDIL